MGQWVARGNIEQISYIPQTEQYLLIMLTCSIPRECNCYVCMHVYVCTCVHVCVCMHMCMRMYVCMCVHMCMCACLHELLATNLCEFSPQTNVVDLGGFCPKVRGEVHEEARHRVKP